MELLQKYQKSEIGIGFPKESPYHELMNHYILRILESGLISKNTRNTEPPSQKCDYTIGSPLGFKNCITPFLVLIGGIGLALMSLASEMSFKQFIGSKMTVENPPEIKTNEEKNLSCVLLPYFYFL